MRQIEEAFELEAEEALDAYLTWQEALFEGREWPLWAYQ